MLLYISRTMNNVHQVNWHLAGSQSEAVLLPGIALRLYLGYNKTTLRRDFEMLNIQYEKGKIRNGNDSIRHWS